MPRRRRRRKYQPEPLLDQETRREVVAVVFFALAGLTALAYFGIAGKAGIFIDEMLKGFMGVLRPLLPIALAAVGAVILRDTLQGAPILGLLLLLLSATGLTHLLEYPGPEGFIAVRAGLGGGYMGLFLAYPLYQVFGLWAALIILAALGLISFSLLFSTPLTKLLSSSHAFLRALGRAAALLARPFKHTKIHGDYKEQPTQQELGFEEHQIEREETNEDEREGREVEEVENEGETTEERGRDINSHNSSPITHNSKRRIGPIEIPLDLLDKNGTKPVSGNIRERQEIIVKTLQNFGIDVELGDVSVGPTVTQYTLRPAVGVKLSSITALANDLSLALAAHPIRIEAPIPGKSLVGIEVPNAQVSTVRLREALESKPWGERTSPLSVVLGRDVAGHPWIGDLSRMPHLLVAGATGSGKTVCLNTVILSLLYQNGPDDLKFILIDPKRVELPAYNGIPHLMTPVITDVKQTVQSLRWAILEMERRFEALASAGARDIKSYNDHVAELEKEGERPGMNPGRGGFIPPRMPYLVIIVDELADLMAAAASEVEGAIIRLAQMARAVGIHLVLATQRPSVDVITGLIKANITSRIAFSVASITDSRTILDCAGAEKLLGRGDMLFMTAEVSKPKRLQGVYVSDQEIKRVVEFLKKAGSPEYVEIAAPQQAAPGLHGSGVADGEEDDPLLTDAKEIILQAGKASASLLQRRLKIGYARAARILDLLEEEGFIGPADGAKPREILAPKE